MTALEGQVSPKQEHPEHFLLRAGPSPASSLAERGGAYNLV
jgi:hypothetical protein